MIPLPRVLPAPLRRHPRLAVALALAAGLPLLAWLAALAISFIPLATAPYLAAEPSPELLDRNGRTLHVFLNSREQWCLPRPLDQISPWLRQATLAAEDQRFESHGGIDGAAILRAAVQNARGGRIVSGASTLPMQVAKLGGLDSRSFAGKLRQAALALRLDRQAGKPALLAAYLNKAPYGMNLVGAEAAARRWFGRTAAELTLPEAALLAALPRAPTALDPLAHPERARRARNHVLARMHAEGMIDEARLAESLAAPLGARIHPFPAAAPHLAMRLRPALRAPNPPRATLDAAIQAEAQRLLAHRLEVWGSEIDSGAALVIDVRTAEVLAHVGSPDFFHERAGQFDATRAERSPGSTLKPFTYALALERGRLYPTERLLDDTLDLGRWRPRNFGGGHAGLVPADQALRRSLNVPAVLIFGRLGEQAMQDFLRAAGLSTLTRSAGFYGYGMALGNCEARLDQLAGAYAMLAALGDWRPLRWTLAQSAASPIRLLERDTCLALYQMLEQPLPGRPARQPTGALPSAPPVCWKTGTSTGNRDAWAFVYNGQYVVGVWFGNHDGRPSRRLIGAEAALPMAARLFQSLPARPEPAWPAMAADELRPVQICPASGLPIAGACPHAESVLLPRGPFLDRICEVHWPAPAGGVVERWPASARGWDLAAVGQPPPNQPPPDPDRAGRPFEIIMPAYGGRYLLTGEPGGDRLRLESSLDQQGPVHWFQNDRYLGASQPGRPLMLELTAGSHRLVCVAPTAERAVSEFHVDHPQAIY